MTDNYETKFALSPADSVLGIIDFSTSEGRKIYNGAVKQLDDELYNCEADGLYQFIQSVSERCSEYGWQSKNETGIVHIPKIDEDGFINLINKHGSLDLDRIREFESTYINNECRAAQDTRMLYKALMHSLNKAGKDKIRIWRNDYVVDGSPSGVALFKVIVRESHLDTNATTGEIRTNLSSLDTYMMSIGCDIVKFNSYVLHLLSALHSRGETTQDLLQNLFKGYMVVTDPSFVTYVEKKCDDYEDGSITLSPKLLMQLAANKFKSRKVKKLWMAPSAEEEKILALQAQIKHLKRNRGAAPKNKQGYKGKNPKGKRDDKSKKPEWMATAPKKEDLHKPKKWNERNWYYCGTETGGKCGGVWRCHLPTKCEGKAFKYADKKADKKAPPNKRTIQLEKSFQAVIDNDSDDFMSEGSEDA